MKTQRTRLATLLLLATPTLAHAHHAMGGKTPSTLFEGLVSGFAHPVIGLDHLLFVLAIGAACYAFRRGPGTAVAFVAATIVGTGLHLERATIPFAEAWVAGSLIVAGIALLRARPRLAGAAAGAFIALAGVFHGYAYGESIVGAEATPLAGYLVGFTLIQLAIAYGGYALARVLDRRSIDVRRAFGGALSLTGAIFLALALV